MTETTATLPLYRQLARDIAADISSGALAPGTRLPTQRDMAHRRGVTVGTVSRAYAELQRDGLIRATVGRGSFVHAPAQNATAAGEIDLLANHPPIHRLGPALLRSLSHRLDEVESGLFNVQNVFARPQRYAEIAAEWLQRHHGVPPGDEPILSSGGQQALACCLGALCRPGDLVATEEYTYIGLIMAAQKLGLRLVGIPADADGLLPSELAALCERETPRLLVCTPNFNSPTTAVLSASRRKEVAALARRHDFHVVEDDVYGALCEERLPPLRALLPERAILFTSFAKILAPGLHAGLISAPAPLLTDLSEQLRIMAGSQLGLTWDIVVDWMETGFLDELVDMNRQEIGERYALARTILSGLDVAGRPTCPHIWLGLPHGMSSMEFGSRAYAAGVRVLGSEQFAVGQPRGGPHVRISLSAARSQADLGRALTIVRELATSNADIVRTLA